MNILKLSPSGRFTAGYVRKSRKTLTDPIVKVRLDASQIAAIAALHKMGYTRYVDSLSQLTQDAMMLGETPPKQPSAIDLTRVPNFNRREVKRGSKGLTGYGRGLVQDAVAILERRWSRENLALLTLTLPPCAIKPGFNWAKTLNRFKVAWGRLCEAKGIDPDLIGVVEIQMERFRETGVVAPHLHCVIPARKTRRSKWLHKPDEIRAIWAIACDPKRGATDLGAGRYNAAVDMVQVYSSAGGYLAKYMSKGKDDVQAITASGQADQLPSHWYTCTKELRSSVKRETILINDPTEAPILFDMFMRNSTQLFRGDGIRFVYGQIASQKDPVIFGAIGFARDAQSFEALRAMMLEVRVRRFGQAVRRQLSLL